MKHLIIYFFFIVGYGLTGLAQKINTGLAYLVNEPAKKSDKTPVLIMLHGYGANEEDLFDIAKAIDPRFMTFSLRGTFPKSQGGFCWYELAIGQDGQFQYDYKQVQESNAKIRSFISQACKAYQLDSSQVFLMGFSQGAIMSYELASSFPAKIKGVVALSGRLMQETKQLKTDWTKVAHVKFFIGHGLSDNLIKVAEAEKAFAFFDEKKVTELTYKTYEIPHSISGAELNDVKAWLLKAITAKPGPTPDKK